MLENPCHKPSFGDNTSIVDKSPVTIFDQKHHPQLGQPPIVGPEHPGAFKTNGSRQAYTRCVHVNEDYSTYHEAVAYKYVFGTSLSKFAFGKNHSVMLLGATDDVFTGCPK